MSIPSSEVRYTSDLPLVLSMGVGEEDLVDTIEILELEPIACLHC